MFADQFAHFLTKPDCVPAVGTPLSLSFAAAEQRASCSPGVFLSSSLCLVPRGDV